MGIRDKPIAPASPWQNSFAERLIGSIWRECVDHIVVLDETHLRRILQTYACYYNKIRTYRSLDKDTPVSRTVLQPTGGIKSHLSLADFITITSESRFSVHTARLDRQCRWNCARLAAQFKERLDWNELTIELMKLPGLLDVYADAPEAFAPPSVRPSQERTSRGPLQVNPSSPHE